MTGAPDIRAEARAQVRSRVRDLALDLARNTVLRSGWGAVRMGELATSAGTSRQSLHAEFGTKEDLGLALVMRETEIFFEAVAARLDSGTTRVETAVVGAAEQALRMVSVDPLLQAVLGAGAGAADTGLLPLLTSRGEPLLARGQELFGEWLRRRLPDLDPRVAAVVVESTVRLLVSHAVTPTRDPREAAEDLGLLVQRLVR